jgi:signal transduction histidine kinase
LRRASLGGDPAAGRVAESETRESPDSTSSEDRKLEALLSGALGRLSEETGAEMLSAWAIGGGDAPVLLAGIGGAGSFPPGTNVLEALFTHSRATDLAEPGLDGDLGDFARKAGFVAAVPLAADHPIAVIFLGAGPRDRLGGVRPRTLAALDDFASRLRGPAGTLGTIAHLSRFEVELARMTRLAALGDLLAEAVHEVRNPLVSVKTFLQLLPDNLDDPDFHENFRGQVVDEVRRMERLLDSLLQQARPAGATPGTPSNATLGLVLESVGRLLEKRAQEKQLRLVVDVGADLPDAAIEEDALRQIVLNLALNAFEATPEAGRVQFTARLAEGAAGDEPALVLTVDDEGPGVPESERSRLFEPFFSTRADRPVGLGLSVCRRLVTSAGGSIHVESSPGERGGARFYVRLPTP